MQQPPQREVRARAASAQARRPLNPFSITLAAGCAALAASGAVPPHDVTFSLAWPAYLAAVNAWRFDSNSALTDAPPHPLVPGPWVPKYAAAAALLALLIPAAVCILNRGSAAVLAAVGPHLYLTAAQVVCEFFLSGPATAMLPRMLVPLGFNTYRMWTLVAWCGAVLSQGRGPWHLALAVSNLAFWSFNLFVFLLLKMLPLYLDPRKCAV